MSHLKFGDKGNGVKNLQRKLQKVGVRPKVTVNGEFDETTDKAVKAFQKKIGMEPTGRACGNTLYGIELNGKPVKWTLRDVSGPATSLAAKRRDLAKSRIAIMKLARENKGNDSVRAAYENYDRHSEQYATLLRDFLVKLREIEKIERRFHGEIKGYPLFQKHALRDATALFTQAEYKNKTALKMAERHDKEHDAFLELIASVPA
ncbi:MAG: peptidoglycan-binding domain-containing protein [Pseudomonadota bacterium]